MGEVALVREAGARGDLCQGEAVASLQELLGPLDAAHDDVLVRRQPGGGLELPHDVLGAEAGERGHRLRLPRPARIVRPNAYVFVTRIGCAATSG